MHSNIVLAEIPTLRYPCIPYPQGGFITGCSDVMIGKGVDGSMIRFYYPTAVGNIKDIPPKKWTKWFLGPKHNKGIARLEAPAHMETVYALLANIFQKNTLVPAIWEAPILDSKFPVIVFSHGLATNRSIYSSVCNDLASYGFVVAAVEHRDESASATMIYTDHGKAKWIIQRNVSPHENNFEVRKKQVEIRTEECSRALDVMVKLNDGVELNNEVNSSFDLRTLKGKFDLSKTIIAGHSFGGSAAMLTSYKDKRFKFSIILDPWTFPIKDKVEQMAKNTNQPMLFILMEKFQTEKNLNELRHFFQIERNEFYTIRKGTHLHQMDIALLFSKYPILIQKKIACYEPTISVEIPYTISNVLMKNFAFKKLGMHHGYETSCKKFLAQYDSEISKNLLCKGKKMRGWDF